MKIVKMINYYIDTIDIYFLFLKNKSLQKYASYINNKQKT